MGAQSSTPDERADLVAEARGLAAAALHAPPATYVGAATSSSVLLASIAARADVDALAPAGRLKPLKQGILKGSAIFLRSQADVNRLTLRALEDVVNRLDAIEARLDELEGGR